MQNKPTIKKLVTDSLKGIHRERGIDLIIHAVTIFAIPLIVFMLSFHATNKSLGFYILSANGLIVYSQILYRTINPGFTKDDSFYLDWIIPALYIAMFLLLIFYFSLGWFNLGSYGGTPCKLNSLCDFKEALYFSVSTSTTLGYGDFTPKTDAARTFACVQVLTSLLHGILGFAFLMKNLITPGTISQVYYRETSNNARRQGKIIREPVDNWPNVAKDLKVSGKRYIYSLNNGKEGTWTEL